MKIVKIDNETDSNFLMIDITKIAFIEVCKNTSSAEVIFSSEVRLTLKKGEVKSLLEQISWHQSKTARGKE